MWLFLKMHIFVRLHNTSYCLHNMKNESVTKTTNMDFYVRKPITFPYTNQLDSNHSQKSISRAHNCVDPNHTAHLLNGCSTDLTGNGDTTSQNDLVRKQYSSLPYPAVREADFFSEKEYYDSGLASRPYSINPPLILEQMNHFLYSGGNTFM